MGNEQRIKMIFDLFLQGKLETEIADRLDISENEIKAIIKLTEKDVVDRIVGLGSYTKVKTQKKENQKRLNKILSSDFNKMGNDELSHLIYHFILSQMNVEKYCEQYGLSEDIFSLYLLNLSYLKNKLGINDGLIAYKKILSYLQQVTVLENTNLFGYGNLDYQSMLQELAPLYLDSLFKPKEFMEYVHIDEETFKQLFWNEELMTKAGYGNLLAVIKQYQTKVSQIRSYGTLPDGHHWIKEPNVRRAISPNIYSLPKKELESLKILVSYYENNGNIEIIKKEQSKTRNKIQMVIENSVLFSQVIQPDIIAKIEELKQISAAYKNDESTPRITGQTYFNKFPEPKKFDISKIELEEFPFVKNNGIVIPSTVPMINFEEIVATKKQDFLEHFSEEEKKLYEICAQVYEYNMDINAASVILNLSKNYVQNIWEKYSSWFGKTENGVTLPYDRAQELFNFVINNYGNKQNSTIKSKN